VATAEPVPRSNRVILTIAGSDPSGGAGIQADLKTFATLEVYGAAAISCLTVQNTTGVFAINPVAPRLVREQAAMVLTDLPVGHIKLGMLGTRGIVRAVGEVLAGFAGEVICDPILRSSSGRTLLAEDALAEFKREIVGRATALTPNYPEFRILTGSGDAEPEIETAARQLLADYPRIAALVLKGGHRQEQAAEVVDTLYLRDRRKIKKIESRRLRVKTGNTHGTGCTFASALAAGHLRTGSWEKAFLLACAYLDQLLHASAASRLGQGAGPLLHHLHKN
jgi:hydroxymethylpyrimidine kinase/phosphomethylpyrimidine kinase